MLFKFLLCSLPAVLVAESSCSVPLSTREAWKNTVISSYSDSHSIVEGSLTFAAVGTISNPSGTYGAHVFPDQLLSPSICECLKGACNNIGPPPQFSNKDVEGPCIATYEAKASAALVTIGCLPPEEVQYFALQVRKRSSKWLQEERSLSTCDILATTTSKRQEERSDGCQPVVFIQRQLNSKAFCLPATSSVRCIIGSLLLSCRTLTFPFAPIIDEYFRHTRERERGEIEQETPSTCHFSPRTASSFLTISNPLLARSSQVFFPEVSPLPSINQLTMGTPPGSPYIIVSTGDADLADKITTTLVAAGAPEESIHHDGLSHPSLTLDGESADVLEVVARINNKDFSKELIDYIEASAVEQLALYLDPIDPPSDVNLLPASPVRQRSIESDPSAPDYAQELDNLTNLIEKKLADLGFVMSYSGEMPESMDFGYDDTDTDACCIDGYFESDTYWHSMIHFSTNDCLYRAFGAWADPYGMWNDGNLTMVGNTLSVNYDVIGESADVSSYTTFSCNEENEPLIGFSCDDKCSSDVCKTTPLSTFPSLAGCVNYDKFSIEFGCSSNSTAIATTYLRSDCQGIEIGERNLETCTNSSTHYEGEIWAGGIAKDTTVSFVVGVRTNKLGLSSFHNVYLPDFSSYNDKGDKSSFSEESLEGSAGLWGWEDDDLFVAEFSRACTGDASFCKVRWHAATIKAGRKSIAIGSRRMPNKSSPRSSCRSPLAGDHRPIRRHPHFDVPTVPRPADADRPG